MSFGCWCYLDIVAKDGEFSLERKIFIDFVPTKGMRFVFDVPADQMDKKDYDNTEYFDVDVIEYHESGVFWLSERRDHNDACPCGPEDNCCVLGTDLEFYIRRGWSLRDGPTMLKDEMAKHDWWEGEDWQFSRKQLGFAPAKLPNRRKRKPRKVKRRT